MASGDVQSALRFVVGCALVYVLFALFGQFMSFTSLVFHGAQVSRAASAAQHKQQARLEIESRLKKMNALRLLADSSHDLRCEERSSSWSYVCSFAPTPKTSGTRVQFGVIVDSTGTVRELSSFSPVGTDIAPPRNPTTGR